MTFSEERVKEIIAKELQSLDQIARSPNGPTNRGPGIAVPTRQIGSGDVARIGEVTADIKLPVVPEQGVH